MTTMITVTYPSGGTAKIPLSYLPHAERRGAVVDGAAEVPPADVLAMPSRSASKADWVAYAVEVGGMDPTAAEEATRGDLADLFAPADHDG